MTIAPHEDPHRTPEENDGDDDDNDDGCNRDTMPTTKTRMTCPFAYVGRNITLPILIMSMLGEGEARRSVPMRYVPTMPDLPLRTKSNFADNTGSALLAVEFVVQQRNQRRPCEAADRKARNLMQLPDCKALLSVSFLVEESCIRTLQ